jgi:hypothetical protein
MTIEKVAKGGRRYLKFARRKLAQLDALRRDIGLQAMSKAYKVGSSLIWIKASEWKDLIYITGAGGPTGRQVSDYFNSLGNPVPLMVGYRMDDGVVTDSDINAHSLSRGSVTLSREGRTSRLNNLNQGSPVNYVQRKNSANEQVLGGINLFVAPMQADLSFDHNGGAGGPIIEGSIHQVWNHGLLTSKDGRLLGFHDGDTTNFEVNVYYMSEPDADEPPFPATNFVKISADDDIVNFVKARVAAAAALSGITQTWDEVTNILTVDWSAHTRFHTTTLVDSPDTVRVWPVHTRYNDRPAVLVRLVTASSFTGPTTTPLSPPLVEDAWDIVYDYEHVLLEWIGGASGAWTSVVEDPIAGAANAHVTDTGDPGNPPDTGGAFGYVLSLLGPGIKLGLGLSGTTPVLDAPSGVHIVYGTNNVDENGDPSSTPMTVVLDSEVILQWDPPSPLGTEGSEAIPYMMTDEAAIVTVTHLPAPSIPHWWWAWKTGTTWNKVDTGETPLSINARKLALSPTGTELWIAPRIPTATSQPRSYWKDGVKVEDFDDVVPTADLAHSVAPARGFYWVNHVLGWSHDVNAVKARVATHSPNTAAADDPPVYEWSYTTVMLKYGATGFSITKTFSEEEIEASFSQGSQTNTVKTSEAALVQEDLLFPTPA